MVGQKASSPHHGQCHSTVGSRDGAVVRGLASHVGFTKAASQRYQFMDEISWKLLGKYYIAVKILQMCKSRGIADIIIISVTFLDVTPYLWRDVFKKIISAP